MKTKIMFSHRYFKMPVVIDNTYLIGVSKINYNKLPKGFIFYDTLYCDRKGNLLNYTLPKADLIILTLFSDSEQSPRVWTTIRRYTPEQYKYYNGLIGRKVNIVIEQEIAKGD